MRAAMLILLVPNTVSSPSAAHMDIGQQLGELLLRSIPTIILLLIIRAIAVLAAMALSRRPTSGRGGGGAYCRPHPLRGAGHVDVAHAEVRQRVDYRVLYGGGGADRS